MKDPFLLVRSKLVDGLALTDLNAANEEPTIVTFEKMANMLSVRSVAVFPKNCVSSM